MLCSFGRLSLCRGVLNRGVLTKAFAVRFGGNVAAPWRPNGEMAKTSLHADIPAPQYKDEDRLAGWRGQTDAIDRNASNNVRCQDTISVDFMLALDNQYTTAVAQK